MSDESPDFEASKQQNATYDQALKDRIGNDSFVPRGTQTLNPLMKTKDTNTVYTHSRDTACDSAGMDIADMVSRAANATQTDFVDLRSKGKKSRSVASGKDLPVKEVLDSALLLERLITQNMFHDRHMLYRFDGQTRLPHLFLTASCRNTEKPEVSDTLSSKRLDPLWTYKCDLTSGRTVSGMCWNEVQRDVLAVSFCQFEFSKQKGGLIVFWSLRTPAYPEKYIETSSGVTSVAFSKKSPQLLAAGCHDGSLIVYDISRPENPFVKSTFEDGKHSDAIWDLQWVDRGAERGEMLVSSSTDGRVTMWSVKKGLEHSDLIKLKRVASKLGAGDVFISRNASATALDFASFDSNIYIVATEDGHIHKCSCSYNEQYLETYSGHQGPVYRIRWAPHHPQVFMSCSADWSVKIWHCDTTVPLLTTQPCTEPVMDIAWSPRLSTVFATVTRDGTIAVWNILHSLLDPVASVKLSRAPTRVLFGHLECPVLLAGDEDGIVHVFRLVNLDDTGMGMSPEEQRKKLETAFATKVRKSKNVCFHSLLIIFYRTLTLLLPRQLIDRLCVDDINCCFKFLLHSLCSWSVISTTFLHFAPSKTKKAIFIALKCECLKQFIVRQPQRPHRNLFRPDSM